MIFMIDKSEPGLASWLGSHTALKIQSGDKGKKCVVFLGLFSDTTQATRGSLRHQGHSFRYLQLAQC